MLHDQDQAAPRSTDSASSSGSCSGADDARLVAAASLATHLLRLGYLVQIRSGTSPQASSHATAPLHCLPHR
jgi:hypothetical protein